MKPKIDFSPHFWCDFTLVFKALKFHFSSYKICIEFYHLVVTFVKWIFVLFAKASEGNYESRSFQLCEHYTVGKIPMSIYVQQFIKFVTTTTRLSSMNPIYSFVHQISDSFAQLLDLKDQLGALMCFIKVHLPFANFSENSSFKIPGILFFQVRLFLMIHYFPEIILIFPLDSWLYFI